LTAEQRQREYEALFSQGLAHLESRHWAAAIETFDQLQREHPEHPDSAALLARARERLAQQEEEDRQEQLRQEQAAARQQKLEDLYAAAERAYHAGEWTAVIQHLESLLELDASYQQASVLLEQAKRQQELAELYAEARRLHANGDWQAVKATFDRIHSLDSHYADPDGLLSSASERLVAEQQEATVAALYDQGVAYTLAKEWDKATQSFEQVSRLRVGYRDTASLLQGARIQHANWTEQQRLNQKEAERRQQADALFQQAVVAQQAERWDEAIQQLVQEGGGLPENEGGWLGLAISCPEVSCNAGTETAGGRIDHC
jgi:outer membrane protein assembly factor BamD (BamD/ComL family)